MRLKELNLAEIVQNVLNFIKDVDVVELIVFVKIFK